MYPLLAIRSHEILAIQSLFILLIILPALAVMSVRRNDFTNHDRYVWLTIIILLPIIGPFLYIFIGRNRRLNRY
ncbi:PLDc N-terminal domain-containing protein [Gaoshiqia sediminis]|uniref:PLDc N-terminal domain-containing protein n=1 Tax=Gaoshiqia sediminis TaxID=2986998 RepID=UPI003D0C487B